MSTGVIRRVLSLGAIVFSFAALVMADKGKAVDIYTDAVLPDGQVLKAGKYQVVVVEAAGQVQFMKGSKEVVKHHCKCIDLKERNRYTQARYVESQAKKQQLQELRLGGDTRAIVLD